VTDASDESTAGSVYDSLLKDLVESEDARRTSLQSRASTVVSVSATLVTLLSALAAATRGSRQPSLSPSVRVFVIAAIAAFLVAGICAVLTYAPRSFVPYDVEALKARLTEHWRDPMDEALGQAVAERLQQLQDLQDGNNKRGAFLVAAVAAQVAAAGFLGAAVVLTLLE
jgi:MFS-type transporter involved in bile tolerance (Atg22 family)